MGVTQSLPRSVSTLHTVSWSPWVWSSVCSSGREGRVLRAVPSWEGASHRPEGKGERLGSQGQAGALALLHGWCLGGRDMLVSQISASASVPRQSRVCVWEGYSNSGARLSGTAYSSTCQGTLGNYLISLRFHFFTSKLEATAPLGLLQVLNRLLCKVLSRVSKMQINQ